MNGETAPDDNKQLENCPVEESQVEASKGGHLPGGNHQRMNKLGETNLVETTQLKSQVETIQAKNAGWKPPSCKSPRRKPPMWKNTQVQTNWVKTTQVETAQVERVQMATTQVGNHPVANTEEENHLAANTEEETTQVENPPGEKSRWKQSK